ncbi:MAG: complex I NDUFA9 subunit family protein, partial [Paracoccaceae bacterium]|nr:complex I NDUFA9 subunit family protein [Paracoccaceae bacterium]
EEAILRNYPDCTIFRPSVIFGNEDEFFNKFAAMARLSPVLPLPGANTRFQPVYVDDVAKAVEQAVFSKDIRGIYELGGNEILTLKELIDLMLEVIRRKRLVIPLPPEICSPLGWALDMVQIFSGGLVKNNLLTRDQLIQLGSDNVVSGDFPTLQDLKISPTLLESVLEDYLYSYRPAGQFTSIHESSGGLGKNQDF